MTKRTFFDTLYIIHNNNKLIKSIRGQRVEELITINSISADDTINKFLTCIDTADTTKEAYKKGLKKFFTYLADNNIKNITQSDIVNYKNYLIKHNEAPTINLCITALKRFYKFLASHYNYIDYTLELKTITLKKDHKKDGLNIDQAKALLHSTDKLRDKAILLLLLTGALRTIELERANIEDLQTKGNNFILQVQGKGHSKKDDYIIITKSTYKAINDYLATRKNLKPTDPLFTNNSNHNNSGRLTTRSIRRIVKRNLQQIGINTPKITTHSLRHTAITQAIINGADLLQAQQLARHKSPSTTQIYIDEIVNEKAKETTASILEEALNL